MRCGRCKFIQVKAAAAALARAAASLGVYDPLALLQLAVLCWSGAFALLLILLVRVRAYRN